MNMITKPLAAMVAAIMAMFAAPVVSAFDSTPYPDAGPPDGSAAHPWKIDRPQDFDDIGSDGIHLRNQHYRLTRDIDCGNQDHRIRADFSGTLDGAYHIISAIRADQPGEGSGALVSNMEAPGIIRRLAVVGSYFRFRDAAGSIAGRMQWGTLVEECLSQGNTIIAISGNGQGGIAGASSYERPAAVIRNSYARDNSISSGFQTVGGICGYNDALIERCYSAGSTLTAPRYVGGIAGYQSSGTIIDSYSHVTNSPAIQEGSGYGVWQNTLVPNRGTNDFDIALYSIAQLNWDTAVWVTGAEGHPCLAGFNRPEIAVEQPSGTDLQDGTAVIDFGSVLVGASGAQKTFTITNRGTADMTGLAVTKNGAHPGDFTVGAPGAPTLVPGASTTFTVTFMPAALGSRSANLLIASDDFDENPFDITLTGTGGSPIVLDPGLDAKPNNPVNTVAVQADGAILIGGTFIAVDGNPHLRIARLKPDGALEDAFNPGVDGHVEGLHHLPNGKILVNGWFETLGGHPRANIGLLNSDGSVDHTFNPDANPVFSPGPNNKVVCTAIQNDGRILVAGMSNASSWFGRLNADGSLDATFNPVPNSLVNAIAVQADGKIVVGGYFTTLGGQVRHKIGRLNADGSVDSAFNPGVQAGDRIECLAVQADGRILVGGVFSQLGGLPCVNMGRLNPNGSLDTSFHPSPNNSVISMALQSDGRIIVGGWFGLLCGELRSGLGRLNSDGSLDPGFAPMPGGGVNGVALQNDGKILVGGQFSLLAGSVQPNIGRLMGGGASMQTLSVTSVSKVEWLRAGTAPETSFVTFELSAGGSTWTPLGTGTRITGGWELTGMNLPASGTIRARARTIGGFHNGSSGLVEATESFDFNTPPVADAGADQAVQLGSTAYLDGGGTTDDFTPVAGLVYAWAIESAPAGSAATVSGADTVTAWFKPDLAGDYTVKLTVTDGAGLQDTDETVVTATEVLANGSFEHDLAGWNTSGNVAIQSGPPYQATDGTHLVSFNAVNSAPGGRLWQVIATVPGQAYRLEYDVGVLAYNTSVQVMEVEVRGLGPLVSERIPIKGLGGGKVVWVSKSHRFIADSAATTLTFTDSSSQTANLDLLLDHVRVTPLAFTLLVTSSPEPAVAVTAMPPDTAGGGDGMTSFRRIYNPGVWVELTAPADAGGMAFSHWVMDGSPLEAGRTAEVIMDGDHRLTAVYGGGLPVVTLQPAGMEAVAGGSAVFTVMATGDTPLFYQWRFNGGDIPGAGSNELVIGHVESSHAGLYDVVVSNALGSVTSDQAEFVVRSGFTGLENGSFEADFQGWTVSGNISIQSSPPYRATDGVRIAAFNAGNSPPGGTLSQVFTTTPGQSYQLVFDMGVLAYNHLCQTLDVEVTGSPALLARSFDITGTGDGSVRWESHSLSFTADSARTTISFHDGSAKTVAIDLLLDHVRVVPRVIRNLVVTSSGLPHYGLPVTLAPPDEQGLGGSNTIFGRQYLGGTIVTLSVPARFYTFFAPGIALTYQFQEWRMDGVLYDTRPDTSLTMDADRTLEARYVVAPPVITSQPQDVTAVLGTLATFRVTAAEVTVATSYQWRFNGIALPGATADTLTVGPVEAQGYAGTYDVVVTNPGGSTTSEPATMTVVPALLANDSFESDFDGWNSGGNVRIQTSPTPTDGTMLVAFNAGNTTPDGWISQTFTTVPGTAYRLSFDMGVIAYRAYEQRLKVELTGNTLLASQTFSLWGTSGGKTLWQTRYLVFTADSNTTTVRLQDVSPTSNSIDLLLDNLRLDEAPPEFSTIPAGTFRMGDDSGDGESKERPVHEVFVSGFQIGRLEVTKDLWDQVRAWAIGHGYTDLPVGTGKSPDHPVHSVSWLATVKWCNARSEKEGLTPCYNASGTVFRTGSTQPSCNWRSNGYRLPTEAEWEKSARGGMVGERFPWGDTILHEQANYYVYRIVGTTNYYSYDKNPTYGYHPSFQSGSSPFTSPVGGFAANGYGLHDMAGNLWEWCWDPYSATFYGASPSSDPRGASSGTSRVYRGGCWLSHALRCRVAYRLDGPPGLGDYRIGFRLARNSTP